jgi:hypothetical protein
MLIRLRRYYFYAYEETDVELFVKFEFLAVSSLEHFFDHLVHATFEAGLDSSKWDLLVSLTRAVYEPLPRCGSCVFARTWADFRGCSLFFDARDRY